MSTFLDLAVSQSRWQARLLEHAVHGSAEGWEIEFEAIRLPVKREVLQDRVVFSAVFPGVCLLGDEGLITLLHNGEEMSMRRVEHAFFTPGETVVWAIVVPQRVPA